MSIGCLDLPKGIYATHAMLPALGKFLECRAVKALLDGVISTAPIEFLSSEESRSSWRIEYASDDTRCLISIFTAQNRLPMSDGKSYHVFSDLAHQLYGITLASEPDALILEKAEQGNVGLEEYALSAQRHELAVSKKATILLLSCSKEWNVDIHDPDSNMRVKTTLDLETLLFVQQWNCKIDALRKHWVDAFQALYCKIHPEDHESCSAKSSDFCDDSKVFAMSESDRNSFFRSRFCKLFQTAHPNVHKHSDLVEQYKRDC